MYPILFLLLLPLGCLWAQAGCTDSLARNYNAAATTNDGSCIFDTLSLSPDASFLLDSALDETSGLAYWQGQLWTHNDDTDTALYALDTLDGSILGIYPLPGVRNFDWEELSQDSLYFYLGDFGNNRGNRLDLHILRIEKQSLLSGNPQIDSIAFAYEDQTDFTIALNDNNYDCEALVLSRDSIYLFTKRWVDLRSFVYRLPKEPGSYQAELLDSFDAQGLITGAYYDEDLRLLALCGYSPFLQPFVYSCYDFGGKYFFSGNVRLFQLALNFHQIEAITSADGLSYYLTNEAFSQGAFINVEQQMHKLDLGPYLRHYIAPDTATTALAREQKAFLRVYPNPSTGQFFIEGLEEATPYALYNMQGQLVQEGFSRGEINIAQHSAAHYILDIQGQKALILRKN